MQNDSRGYSCQTSQNTVPVSKNELLEHTSMWPAGKPQLLAVKVGLGMSSAWAFSSGKLYCPGGTAWPEAKRTFWHLRPSGFQRRRRAVQKAYVVFVCQSFSLKQAGFVLPPNEYSASNLRVF